MTLDTRAAFNLHVFKAAAGFLDSVHLEPACGSSELPWEQATESDAGRESQGVFKTHEWPCQQVKRGEQKGRSGS